MFVCIALIIIVSIVLRALICDLAALSESNDEPNP